MATWQVDTDAGRRRRRRRSGERREHRRAQLRTPAARNAAAVERGPIPAPSRERARRRCARRFGGRQGRTPGILMIQDRRGRGWRGRGPRLAPARGRRRRTGPGAARRATGQQAHGVPSRSPPSDPRLLAERSTGNRQPVLARALTFTCAAHLALSVVERRSRDRARRAGRAAASAARSPWRSGSGSASRSRSRSPWRSAAANDSVSAWRCG